MASLERARNKIERAKMLYEELFGRVIEYYESDPGTILPDPASTPEWPLYSFQEKKLVPPIIPLILGDALQCLRSSLDYLVWELVEAAGNTPHDRLMFPIALKETTYCDDIVKRDRLTGVHPEAAAIIDRLQPYLSADPQENMLAILDKLANVNKHRRVIIASFVGLAGNDAALPVGIPCITGIVRERSSEGIVREIPLSAVLTLREGFKKNIEITNCVETAARYIWEYIFPFFEKFF